MEQGGGYRDIIGGVVLIALGVFFVVYAQRWHMGSLARMGPAFLPIVFGTCLGLCGVIIAAKGYFSAARLPSVEWSTASFVLGGMTAFGLLLPLGLLIATSSAVVIASLAERSLTWPSRIVLAVVVTVFVVIVFKVGLGMRIPLW